VLPGVLSFWGKGTAQSCWMRGEPLAALCETCASKGCHLSDVTQVYRLVLLTWFACPLYNTVPEQVQGEVTLRISSDLPRASTLPVLRA
jgi:hypothetical protein